MSERVTIDAMSYGPYALGRRTCGQVVFVPGAAPGDVVDIEIMDDRGSLSHGRILSIISSGPARAQTDPADKALAALAPWSHLTYEAQLASKRDAVVDALVRVAKIPSEEADELVASTRPSPHPDAYRNKIELAVSRDGAGRLRLGVHEPGGHDFIALERYPLALPALASMPSALAGALRYLANGEGLGIHRVSVRASERTRALEVALWTDAGAFPRQAAATALKSAIGATSTVRVIGGRGAARKVKGLERLGGTGFWKERLAGCTLRVSAPAFFQVNTAVAEAIVEQARDWLDDPDAADDPDTRGAAVAPNAQRAPNAPAAANAQRAPADIAPKPTIADLYAGVGTFTAPLLKSGHAAIAVELSGDAVRNLRRNCAFAETRCEIIGGDAAREPNAWRTADVILLDPPRAGLSKTMPELIAAARARTLIYVSCDPQTWARDCARLREWGFVLDRAIPHDMFPHTYHVETLSHFRRQ